MASAKHDPAQLPSGLPAPIDDGAADHLVGMRMPHLGLPSTNGDDVSLASMPGRIVVYAYPRTGRADERPSPTTGI